MAINKIEVPGIGLVTFQKRRGTRAVRIHIQGSVVRVTQPFWCSYAEAIKFVVSRSDWIKSNLKPKSIITHGTYVGKQHQINVQDSSSTSMRSKIKNGIVNINKPLGYQMDSPAVQQKLNRIFEKVLKKECEELITPRIEDLSLEHGFETNSVSYKKLKTRWGSCDSKSNLVFNIYLIQLPWALIDYVIVHELSHTEHHNHSKDFWAKVEECLPGFKMLRKQLKDYHTDIVTD